MSNDHLKTKAELIKELESLRKRIAEETPSERRQEEEKLRASNQQLLAQTQELSRMATVVMDSNDAITIQDLEGNITAWNTGAVKTYGYSEPAALKMNVTDLVPEDYKAEALNFIVSLKKGELVTSLETKRLTQDGKTLDVWMVVTKLVDENGKLIGAATTERDITERKQSVEELKFSNQQFEAALKDLEAFSYSVSHDLRAPLRHISGYVELLQDTFHDVLPEKGKHYLESIASSAHEMSALIDNLLQFSRTGRVEMHKSGNEMNDMVHAIIKSISADNSERLISWHVDKLPMVRCDAQLIKQVWTNLLDNALKYTRTRANAKIDIGVKEETNEYIFFVRDNGVGFDMQYAQKLFGVFQRQHSTGDFEGTGIGLAIVRQIISRHGGRTWAEAELDNGATFYFSLSKE